MKAIVIPLLFLCGIMIDGRENLQELRMKKYNEERSNHLQTDTIIQHWDFTSNYVDERNVEVWLPKGYPGDGSKNYKVLYMHDGQNVFNDRTAYGNVEWEIDETLDSLIQKGLVEPTIVVAIWNNGNKRFPEYMPQVPEKYISTPLAQTVLKENFGVAELLSDSYLKFIVKELKPFIDTTYNVSSRKEDTAIMGSSMGGLISLYAISEYPEVFGAAGCLSTHWPVPLIGQAYIAGLAKSLPDPETHKIYFDYGTETLDAEYEPYQQTVDVIMKEKGYERGVNWITQKFEGAAHNEESWKKRAHIPLQFLLKN